MSLHCSVTPHGPLHAIRHLPGVRHVHAIGRRIAAGGHAPTAPISSSSLPGVSCSSSTAPFRALQLLQGAGALPAAALLAAGLGLGAAAGLGSGALAPEVNNSVASPASQGANGAGFGAPGSFATNTPNSGSTVPILAQSQVVTGPTILAPAAPVVSFSGNGPQISLPYDFGPAAYAPSDFGPATADNGPDDMTPDTPVILTEASPSFGTAPQDVPEPGHLGWIALITVAAATFWVRRRPHQS